MCIRDSDEALWTAIEARVAELETLLATTDAQSIPEIAATCLLYTSDAADERSSVDLGGRRIIKKKNDRNNHARGHMNRRATYIEKTNRHTRN